MPSLGATGQLGNQIFQYLFLRIIEGTLGCEIRTSNWQGNSIFNIPNTDAIISDANYLSFERINTRDDSPELHIKRIQDNLWLQKTDVLDIYGYFQYHTKHLKKYFQLFHEIFTINEQFRTATLDALKNIKANTQPLITIHFRAGDYLEHERNGHHTFIPPSIDQIAEKIAEILISIGEKKPIIYLASDDLPYASTLLKNKGIKHFSATDFPLNANKSDVMLQDFLMLTEADILLISNSSFSFTGAMLNKKSKYFFRPRIGDKKYVLFDPWNDYPLHKKITTLYT